MSNFDIAFGDLIKTEGGWVNDSDDPGRETKFGLSQRYNPELDIKNITIPEAKEVYFFKFWDKYKYIEIRDHKVASKLLRMSAIAGPKSAHKLIQQALMSCEVRVAWDGVLGPKTFSAINTLNGSQLLPAMKSEIAGYLRTKIALKPVKEKYRSGWMKRAYS